MVILTERSPMEFPYASTVISMIEFLIDVLVAGCLQLSLVASDLSHAILFYFWTTECSLPKENSYVLISQNTSITVSAYRIAYKPLHCWGPSFQRRLRNIYGCQNLNMSTTIRPPSHWKRNGHDVVCLSDWWCRINHTKLMEHYRSPPQLSFSGI